jgi:hypothetical protein
MKFMLTFKSLFFLITSFWVIAAHAVPLYYVFEGTPLPTTPLYGGHSNPSADRYLELMGQSMEDPVRYVFYVNDNVSEEGLSEPYGYYAYDYIEAAISKFYYNSTLVSGTGINSENTQTSGSWMGHLDSAPYHTDSVDSLDMSASFEDGSFISFWAPYGWGASVPRSQMGTYDDFVEYAASYDFISNDFNNSVGITDENGVTNSIYFNLRLASVSEENPLTSVPEPSLFYLFGLGLISVGFIKRMKKSMSEKSRFTV